MSLSKGSMDSGCSKKNYDNKCLDPFHNSDYCNIALTGYKCILIMMGMRYTHIQPSRPIATGW